MQGPFATTHGQLFHFQVDVSDPSFSVSSIRSQILPDGLQVLHGFLFLFHSLVQVNQYNPGSANIYAKPWECLLFAIFALNGRAVSQAPRLPF